MPLCFYNALTRGLEPFEPLHPDRVRIYSCGPTVYDYAHIGNWRANVFADLLGRYLLWRGYTLEHVMNLTDVDDKTIRGAEEAGVSLEAFTTPYIEAFFEDAAVLRLRRLEHYPRATEHLPQMIGLIEALQQRGLTYTAGGSVYFAVDRFAGYGRLSGLDPGGLRAGARVDSDEYEKEQARDFVLWKAYKPADGQVRWESPWGLGRPGWHLECSAMSMHYLGSPFDIHTGGVDLQFPHHENEIAQSEGATGRPLARFWLHNEHLLVEGRKMSKRLGNFYTLRDLLAEGIDPIALRYLLLATHYRQPLNFRRPGLEAAGGAVARLREAARLLKERVNRDPGGTSFDQDADRLLIHARQAFADALDDDLNISQALAALFELVRGGNSLLERGLGGAGADRLHGGLLDFDRVVGVLEPAESAGDVLPETLQCMLEEREQARRRREWTEADRLRAQLAEAGILLEDTPEGVRWKWKHS